MSYSFEELEHEDLICILPAYQKNTLRLLRQQGKSNEEIAQIWLEANGPTNTFPFGANNKKNRIYEQVKIEIEGYICNEDKYAEEKGQFLELYKSGKLAAITSMAATIGPVVGSSASFIVPVIVLILDSATKVGIKTWCALRFQERNEEVEENK